MLKRACAMAAALMMSAGGVMGQDKATETVKPPAAATKQPSSELPKLMVGDKAPALAVSKWVKGDAVTGFEKGKTYVVEFWATWCGPCKMSIPHLTELQKDNKDVKFIGVSVWEDDLSLVEPFVKDAMGDKMGYTVAMDDVAKVEGKSAQSAESRKGKMATTWMDASGSGGIPTAFVVNGEGKIAWIGHPMVGLDEAVKKAVSGKQDLAKDAAEYRATKESDAKMKGPMKRFQSAMQEGEYEAALKALDEVAAANPKMAKQLMGTKYRILVGEMKNYDKGYAYGNEIVDGDAKDDAMTLNEVAWLIVDPDNKPEKQDLKLAEKAALRSAELLKGKDQEWMILDTVGAVYFAKGDLTRAIEIQEKAVKLTPEGPQADEIKERLEKYKKAAKAGGS